MENIRFSRIHVASLMVNYKQRVREELTQNTYVYTVKIENTLNVTYQQALK